jgi:exodeoxyribonuclease VII small subunit
MEKSFEEAIEELEDIVEALETGEKSLDESMKVFEKGVKLSNYCSKILTDAEKKIVSLIEENGELTEKNIEKVD